MRAGVIADDLTGAAEMGALLAAHGLRTVVTIGSDAGPANCDAMVIDTESRHVPPGEAAAQVRAALSRLCEWGAERLFKKVDSTLRGNIAAELAAISPDVIFTPAYPALGRIVRDGELYVNGVPFAQTGFAADARTPVPLMRDALSHDDLMNLIDACPGAAFAGSGGLGRAWVASLPRGDFAPPLLPTPRSPLIVCGSRHAASRAQAEAARKGGMPVLLSSEEYGDADKEAAMLAEQAVEYNSDLLILFGGDTSCAVLRRLGLTALWPVRELMPGVALSTAREMMIVTKAGGFGGVHIVDEILQQLR